MSSDLQTSVVERIETVIIGAGQAGIAVARELDRRRRPFVVLEADARVGDVWRRRWDSLRLFTPARFDAVAGVPFPASPHAFPTKDEMADYLESLARPVASSVRTGARVERVARDGERYAIDTAARRIEARHVVVASGAFHRAKLPPFAASLAPETLQLHALTYRNPSQLPPGDVLVVGAGNSGAEIALELARAGRAVTLAGRDPGEVPFRIDGLAARVALAWLVLRGAFHHVLTERTPLGRRARRHVVGRGGPRVRVKAADLTTAGVMRAPRVRGVHDGVPVLENGASLRPAAVVWCTGFRPVYDWLALPVLDAAGQPVHTRGVAAGEPGLYFVGLPFQYAMSSAMVQGVTRDAHHVVDTIEKRETSARRGDGVP